MKKFMWFLRPAVSAEKFNSRWATLSDEWSAPPTVRRWLRSLGTSRPDPHVGDVAPPVPIALEEIWCEAGDAEALRAQLLDRKSGLASHLIAVADLDSSPFALTSENIVVDGPHDITQGVTNTAIWRRRPDLTRQQAQAHWRNVHAPMVIRDGGVTRYVQYYVEDKDAGFDGSPIIYFASQEERDAFAASDAYKVNQLPDSYNFTDSKNLDRWVLTRQIERPIKTNAER